jgi:hypothetical protein
MKIQINILSLDSQAKENEAVKTFAIIFRMLRILRMRLLHS